MLRNNINLRKINFLNKSTVKTILTSITFFNTIKYVRICYEVALERHTKLGCKLRWRI